MRSVFLGVLIAFFWMIPSEAWYYKLYQKRLVPYGQQETGKLLSNEKLGDAIYYNQERMDELRAEIRSLKNQLVKQQKNQKRLEDALIRFRNYYFRNI